MPEIADLLLQLLHLMLELEHPLRQRDRQVHRVAEQPVVAPSREPSATEHRVLHLAAKRRGRGEVRLPQRRRSAFVGPHLRNELEHLLAHLSRAGLRPGAGLLAPVEVPHERQVTLVLRLRPSLGGGHGAKRSSGSRAGRCRSHQSSGNTGPAQSLRSGSGSGGRGSCSKSNADSIGVASRSRRVRLGRSDQLSSMNRITLENSPCSWLTLPSSAYGVITSSGTRNPNPMRSTAGGGTWS